MSAWSNLPNAQHIDWVILSLSTYPDTWATAATCWMDQPSETMWDAARLAAQRASDEERLAILPAARHETWGWARYGAREAAWNAILALVAYDDCDQYLSMHSEQLRAWALMTEHPAAVLLLPMVLVRERIKQQNTTQETV